MISTKTLLIAAAALATASLASAQGDMTVHRMGYNPGNNPAGFNSYGTNSGIAAYSIASQSCNIGDVNLIWSSGNGQTYRVNNRRFEHIGQSWLKHGFCALCETGCGPRGFSGCASQLRVGCADTYSSSLNDGSSGGPKFTVMPTSGDHQHPDPTPTGNSTIRGRLQINTNDVNPSMNAGATYISEGMYVHYEDHQNGFAQNNATWRLVEFANNSNFTMSGASNVNHSTENGLHGWKSVDSSVVITPAVNMNEGGAGIHGYMDVASRVWDNGDGTWDYIFVVLNQNSTQGVESLEIPTGSGVSLTNTWFNDVDYHSGELQDGTDWVMTQNASNVTWACTQTFAQNPNANAINWATAYSFGFTADAGPVSGSAVLDMFEPGVGTAIVIPLDGPGSGTPSTGTAFCFGDVTCPCFGLGAADVGCLNSGNQGSKMTGSGAVSFSNDTLAFNISGVPGAKPGLLLRANNQINVIVGDGILCVGGGSNRSQVQVTVAGSTLFSDFNGSGFGSVANPIGVPTNFQFWYRDTANTCGGGFNFSNAVEIVYVP
jgi:hypothetical protein